VKTVGTPRIMTQGTLSRTGSELDIAIRGEGFFKILMPDGTFTYTRDGSFKMDAQGRIVTAQGNVLTPAITIPANSTGLSSTTTPTVLGQITLTRFINKAGLQPIGDNLFVETPASGTPQDGTPNTDGYGDLMQSNLEQANVEVVSEISDLIAAQDQMLSATSNMMR
jgi:flagellar basal-body rod protein FlgG